MHVNIGMNFVIFYFLVLRVSLKKVEAYFKISGFVCCLFLSFFSHAVEETLILSPGERVFLSRPANQVLRVGDKSLIEIKLVEGKFSLFARKKGQTLLISGDKRYQLFIMDPHLKTKAFHLDRLLKQFKGLSWSLLSVSDMDKKQSRLKEASQKFIIEGELYRFSDWLSLKKASEKYNFEYEFKASMDQELKKISIYFFKNHLKKPFDILWRELPFVLVPEGAPLEDYQEKLSVFGLEVREGKNWFFKAPLLEVELAVVESLSSSSFFAGGSLSEKLSGFTDILSLLNFLKNSGKGKSLHHSTLLAQSGKSLELESGGQIPFSSFHLKSEKHSTSWKSHGLKLSLTPQLGRKKQILLKIKARLSEPLAFNSGDGAPSLKNQTLETEMVLSAGRIFKLFELKKRAKSRNLKGGVSILLNDLNFFNKSHNKYNVNQVILLQIKVLDLANPSKSVSDKVLKDTQRDTKKKTYKKDIEIW